ncbi:PH domain-containing protein [Clostridium sp. BJN0013]|uniref:PH domain-containing protein n=1 Tax=Clostridium sp. BJN0013 TaxID=3236840 RepID=UPI0034C6215B
MNIENEPKTYERIHKNAIKTWIISKAITSIIIIAIYTLVMQLFLIPKFGHILLVKYIVYILALIIISISIADTFIGSFLEYEQWRYAIFEDKVELIKGIIIREKTIIPISRIQNLKIKQGPIQRIYKITSVNIITAGGHYEIPALPLEKAEKITENLKKVIEAGDVVV